MEPSSNAPSSYPVYPQVYTQYPVPQQVRPAQNPELTQVPPTLYPNIEKLAIRSENSDITPWEGYQIIIAVDTSASMRKPIDDTEGAPSRMEFVKSKISEFCVKVFQYDADGIDLFTFGTKVSEKIKINSIDDVDAIFKQIKPIGKTNTHDVIEACFKLHKEYQAKALNAKEKFKGSIILVITDGNPTINSEGKTVDDSKRVRQQIVNISKLVLDDFEVGITFLQVGHDKKATKFCDELDTDLIDPDTNQKVKVDIVDHKSFHDLSNNKRPLTIATVLRDSLFD